MFGKFGILKKLINFALCQYEVLKYYSLKKSLLVDHMRAFGGQVSVVRHKEELMTEKRQGPSPGVRLMDVSDL